MMKDNEQFNVTKEQIARASAICQQVGELLKSNQKTQDLAKANPSDEFFQDPSSTILGEDSIKTAPEPIVALAAFMAQAVEGLQNALNVLSAKIDALNANYAEVTGTVLKAQSETLDLMKASLDAPAESFRAPAAYVAPQKPLEKAEGPTRGFIVEQLEKMVELKKAQMTDVAVFENSGRLAPYLQEEILQAWKTRQ